MYPFFASGVGLRSGAGNGGSERWDWLGIGRLREYGDVDSRYFLDPGRWFGVLLLVIWGSKSMGKLILHERGPCEMGLKV